MSIVMELKQIREKKGLTQGGMGNLLGIAQSQLSHIESGKGDPRLSSLQDIARVLDHELILVPRSQLSIIQSLLKGKRGIESVPAWLPDEKED